MGLVTWGGAAAGTWVNSFAAADLNALANGSVAISSLSAPQVNNGTSLDFFVQFEFAGGSIAPTTGANLVAVLLPLLSDGVTYADGEAGATVANQPVVLAHPYALLLLRTKVASQNVRSNPILLPPGGYKVALLNRAGVALAATGNMLKHRLFTETVG